MTVQEELLVEKDGPLATIILNRPDRFNAFNQSLRKKLGAAVEQLEEDQSIRLVILKGAGRGFCAGADLHDGIEGDVSPRLEAEYKPPLLAIANSSKIYIAQVHGTAAGIGAAFAMNCDLVTMADDASIYMAFAAIGLMPDGGNTKLLLDAMGYHRAFEAVIEGHKIPAADCLTFGIANKLFAVDDLDRETKAWALSLAERAPLAMQAAKRVLRKAQQLTFSEAFSAEAKEQDTLAASDDCQNAIEAFKKKLKPEFHGR